MVEEINPSWLKQAVYPGMPLVFSFCSPISYNDGVPNELVTIPGGGHGNFKADERVRAFTSIRAFLEKNHISQ